MGIEGKGAPDSKNEVGEGFGASFGGGIWGGEGQPWGGNVGASPGAGE